jgi:hypothetical protein
MLAVYGNAEGMITGTQRDADTLVPFFADGQGHLVLVEGTGDQAWSNAQLSENARHLAMIFGETGDRWPGVAPSFFLLSSTRLRLGQTKRWPRWMTDEMGRPRWIELTLPGDIWRPERCDENGRTGALGGHWRRLPRARVARGG